jgi:hypothetical protein
LIGSVLHYQVGLSTSDSILAIVDADIFTIYDIRVCNTLQAFRRLGDMKWSPSRRKAAPQGLSLRDCDRWLWGRTSKKRCSTSLPKPVEWQAAMRS